MMMRDPILGWSRILEQEAITRRPNNLAQIHPPLTNGPSFKCVIKKPFRFSFQLKFSIGMKNEKVF